MKTFIQILVLCVVAGVGVAAAKLHKLKSAEDRPGQSSIQQLAINAQSADDLETSRIATDYLGGHAVPTSAWAGDVSLHRASWTVLRYTRGIEAVRVDGVLQEALDGAKVFDPLVIPIQIQAAELEDALDRLSTILRSEFESTGFNRLGVAFQKHDQRWRVLCLITKRQIEVVSADPTKRRGQSFHLRAALLTEASAASVMVLDPKGSVSTIPATIRNQEIDVTIPMSQQGDYRIEVLLEGDKLAPGPPAALISVPGVPPVRTASARPRLPSFRLLPNQNTKISPSNLVESMEKWTRSFRWKSQLSDLKPHGRLTQIAQKHAEELAQRRTLSHVDLRGQDPKKRVRWARINTEVVSENLATGYTLSSIQNALETSPSHRAELLRPDLSHFGIGVAQNDHVLFVVQLMAGL